jgi:hypothetical protein
MKLLQTIILIGIISIMPIHPLSAQTTKKTTAQKTTVYSEEHALECVQDYYEFYNADESYSDPKVRRVSNNVFYISVKYCSGGKDICYTKENIGTWDRPFYIEKKHDFFWHSKVLILTCTSKTKYTIRVK